ncbi:23S rRNA (uracil(747)-C(5))-methyltransferase RlmC [Marmoricola endophyticus]|uniref:23S rRNA (Uracil(747)-C(5))-methyltransferase RlmC n=1 Tax=Marmoricola endophyticus TaxID=2040280 RepID=A0A917BN93_9ACTN|nr:23S rRNA (uracil(747)-C(5))-methyltransferase RlmC [Marmoricola endophyticus]GGF49688.1 23S rRNA (uracil(747)-C(5))-methyltransferase RlmC [Marmoricola endophyticus]
MQCGYYDAGRCRSCTLIEQPYDAQLAGKCARVGALLDTHEDLVWAEPVASVEEGFRNKAKLVVGGTVAAPTVGILDAERRGVDLRGCGLHEDAIAEVLPALAEFVTTASLTPYDVPARRGELKHLLVTASPTGELMVRFVLRSQEPLARIRKHLPTLLERLPQVVVVSANLQPEHKAVLEGEQEIALTERESLRMPVGGVDLLLRPQSFFQTSTSVADALYRQVRAWVEEVRPRTLWDLYCGVGGFALACAAPGRAVVGVESSEEAVRSARAAAERDGAQARFVAADATTWAREQGDVPELVVVNPPRRGIGPDLAEWLEGSGVGTVVYSSCHPESLARDLAAMPSLRPVRGRVFDMFPQTGHLETAVLLRRDQ